MSEATATQVLADAEFRKELADNIPRLRSFARGLCGNRDLADDLAQEALVKAWAARASYRAGGNFRAWLFTILRNSFYSVSRRASRFTAWDPNLASHTLVSPADAGTSIHFADLERGLGLLPVRQREALLLVTAQGLSYEEAAVVMDCALGTAKSRVARARVALVEFLEGREPPAMPAAGIERPLAGRVLPAS